MKPYLLLLLASHCISLPLDLILGSAPGDETENVVKLLLHRHKGRQSHQSGKLGQDSGLSFCYRNKPIGG